MYTHLQAHAQCLVARLLRGHVAAVHPRVEPGVVAGGQIRDHRGKGGARILQARLDALPQHPHRHVLHQRVHGQHQVGAVLVVRCTHVAPHNRSRGSGQGDVHQARLGGGEVGSPDEWVPHHEGVGLGQLVEGSGGVVRPQVYNLNGVLIAVQLLETGTQRIGTGPVPPAGVRHEDENPAALAGMLSGAPWEAQRPQRGRMCYTATTQNLQRVDEAGGSAVS